MKVTQLVQKIHTTEGLTELFGYDEQQCGQIIGTYLLRNGAGIPVNYQVSEK
jgi:hypothetical protein